ncbi:ABC transporter permease [Patescibacteria group bacterium]|nr:ABC transporter permease [Patescibacteria group bacterium]
MFTGIRRVVRAGFVGFWRSAYVSLASIFVMMVALFVIGSTMLIEQLLTSSLSTLQSKVDINVYFEPSAPQEEIDAVRKAVAALPDVAHVTYLSREDALQRYRERYQNNEIAMQALNELGENPLGATIAIQARETSQYESIARFLEEQRTQTAAQNPIIEDINYARNKESIDTLTSIIAAVERASFITMLVLLIAAVLISFNTIRLAIYTSREEIGIMRLVGASNTFIRGPFMLQGVMYGVISGVLALLILYPVLVWLGPRTELYFEFNLFTYFVGNFTYFFVTLVGIGVAIGLISSTLAVARYLRV